MRRLLLMILIFTLSGNINNIFSWDSTAAKYLPLQVGNVWVYYGYSANVVFQCACYEKYTITGTSQVSGKTYYDIQKVSRPINSTNCGSFFASSRLYSQSKIRIDSVNMGIYGTDLCLIDSLAARKGDSETVCTAYTYYNPSICDTSTFSLFGLIRAAKIFIAETFEASVSMTYMKDIGFVHYYFYQHGPSISEMQLRGCIINGILRGDTSMLTGINQISTEVPEMFLLSQNYPNPFNPSTKISFQIPLLKVLSEGRGVLSRLIVYDVLGREVQILLNEELSAGTYEVAFDGNNLPSGVYYYKLEVSDHSTPLRVTETKKMVLIK